MPILFLQKNKFKTFFELLSIKEKRRLGMGFQKLKNKPTPKHGH